MRVWLIIKKTIFFYVEWTTLSYFKYSITKIIVYIAQIKPKTFKKRDYSFSSATIFK